MSNNFQSATPLGTDTWSNDNIKEEIKSLKRRHEKFLNQRKEVENL